MLRDLFTATAIMAMPVCMHAQKTLLVPVSPLDGNQTERTDYRPPLTDQIRPELVVNEPPGKHAYIPNRWYALEMENDSVYWANVDVSRIIIQMDKGHTLESTEMKSLLEKFGMDSVLGKSKYPDMQNFYSLWLPDADKSKVLELAHAAKSIPYVNFIEPVATAEKTACSPNDPYWVQQWGPHWIYADEVWCYFTGGTRQLIGVIDDAIDYGHLDLSGMVPYGYDFFNDDNGPYPDSPNDQHGTHVTGTIAAKINNGIGISGLINDSIYAAKTVNNNVLDTQSIIDAINAVASISRIRVYNMSLRFHSPMASLETAVNTAFNNGKLLIAAAGNDATDLPKYPAAYANVMSVSAVGINYGNQLFLGSYSNYGNTIDICAPGGQTEPCVNNGNVNTPTNGILSTIPNNTYDSWQGTSMAAPHVTGVAAIIFACNPLLTNVQARNIIQSTALDMGTQGWDQYFGNGMVNAWLAYQAACNQFGISVGNISSSGSTNLCNGQTVTLSVPYNENLTYQWKKNGVATGNTGSGINTGQAGTYTVTVTSLGGCQLITNPVTVSTGGQPPFADIAFSVNQYTVNFGTSTQGATYFWTFGDGSTSTQQNPTHVYASPGSYQVSLSVTNTCGTNTNSSSVQVVSPAGINEYMDAESVTVSPNPATDGVQIKYHTQSTHDCVLCVYDNAGRKLGGESKQSVSGTVTFSFDMSGFAPGIYYAELLMDGQHITKKIVKQ